MCTLIYPPTPAVAGECVREATFVKQFEKTCWVWSWLLSSSENNVWHYGLPAAGPIRPSLPWCFFLCCGTVLGPELCQTKATCRRSKQFGSWQCRTAGKGKVWSYFLSLQKATSGTMECQPRARSVLHCHCVLALRELKLCQTKATCKTQQAIWKLAVQNGR